MFIDSARPALVLAPMDGVTDHLMRRVLTSLMPFSYCVTEFVRVSGIVPPDHVLVREVPELSHAMVTESGTPISLQLLGGDPERLALTAQRAVALGARSIDLNFGCPAPTVNRHDGGATLLKFPKRIEEIVSAVRSATPLDIPVSAKLRLGWDDPSAIMENSYRAARGGASWITIHGRTKMQGYTPPAYWRPIAEVRRSLDIPVVANGEIWSLDDLKRCQEQSGAIHFMIGRGALSEPGFAGKCAGFLGIERDRDLCIDCGDSRLRWLAVLNHLMYVSAEQNHPERHTLARIKQWLNYAHRRGVISWFDIVKRAQSVAEIVSYLSSCSDDPHRFESLEAQSSVKRGARPLEAPL